MKPDDPSPRETRNGSEIDERHTEWRWAGVITAAAIVAALVALLFHGPTRAVPMPPSFAMPYLTLLPDGVEFEGSFR